MRTLLLYTTTWIVFFLIMTWTWCSLKKHHTPPIIGEGPLSKLAPPVVKARQDRYASNAIPWLAVMAHSRLLRVPLYHICDSMCSRYRDTIVHECLTMFCATGAPPPNAITVGIDENESGVTGLSKDISRLAPLPEALQHFGIVSLLRKAYEDRYGPRPDIPCIVHCRLDDVKDLPHRDFQKRIEDSRLLKLLQFCHSRYQRVCIETTLHDVSMMETLMGQLQFHVKVQGHRDIVTSMNQYGSWRTRILW